MSELRIAHQILVRPKITLGNNVEGDVAFFQRKAGKSRLLMALFLAA